MRQIIEWLIGIEARASQIYTELAAAFVEDATFQRFVSKLADDEAIHYQFMGDALACLENNPEVATEMILDPETQAKVEAPLDEIEAAVNTGNIDKLQIMASIFQNEHSEWNDIFLYVINTLKDRYPRFKVMGPSIQNHLRNIETFFENSPDQAEIIFKFKHLAPVWEEKVLVVDDSAPIRALLRSLLAKDGTVETAENGQEAFEKASRDYYSVIISDIDMPVMGGIAFYEKLKAAHGNVGSRFIFISGALNNSTEDYLAKENLAYMAKPFQLKEIRQAVYEIIDRNTL